MIRINDYMGKCWWCGNTADSKEHKIKRTDFERVYGKGPYDHSETKILYRGENSFDIRDAKSNVIKFDQCLCSKCNNVRSKAIDAAYTRFIDYVLSNSPTLFETNEIDLKKVFGTGWQKQKENVLKYYAKHVACQSATGKYEVSTNVINYLNGKEPLKDINFQFELRRYNYELTDSDSANKFIYIGPVIYHHKRDDRVLSLTGWYTLNWFTVNFIYEENVAQSVEGSVLKLVTTDYSTMPRIDVLGYQDQVQTLETFDKSKDLQTMQSFRDRLIKK